MIEYCSKDVVDFLRGFSTFIVTNDAFNDQFLDTEYDV